MRLALASGLCAFALLVSGGFAASASATPTARFSAELSPDKLGASTTITLQLEIGESGGGIPAPLSNLDIQVPENMGFASSTLGLVPCKSAILLERGPAGCPENSRIGEGEVVLKAPFGASSLEESAAISIYMGQPKERHTVFELYADGLTPVIATLFFQSTLSTASPPFGFDIDTPVPATELLPGEGLASVVGMRLSIGPRHLTYHRTVHGRRVAYRPQGISVPETCTRGRHSFPFLAHLVFADGSHLDARSSVACHR